MNGPRNILTSIPKLSRPTNAMKQTPKDIDQFIFHLKGVMKTERQLFRPCHGMAIR